MDSSFISPNIKQEYCSDIIKIKIKYPATQKMVSGEKDLILSEYRSRATMVISVMAGMVTAFMTFIFTMRSEQVYTGQLEEALAPIGGAETIISVLAATMGVLVTLAFSVVVMKKKSRTTEIPKLKLEETTESPNLKVAEMTKAQEPK